MEDFKSIPEKGAQGRVEGALVKVVSPGFLRENNVTLEDERIEKFNSQEKTVVFVMEHKAFSRDLMVTDP